jgi:hypothetical protein
VISLQEKDNRMAQPGKNNLGDRAAAGAWERACWFADFSYIVRTSQDGTISWRAGREDVFSKNIRRLPLLLDSAGFRRELTGTAPRWAHDFQNYLAAIELINPEGFAAWDYPQNRERSLEALREMEAVFPDDERLWPVYSVRWIWSDTAALLCRQIPGWAGQNLAYLFPLNRTQQQHSSSQRDRWVRAAMANAMITAGDPAFRRMVEKHGKVMIGGMVQGPCARGARHVFLVTLANLFPEAEFWGLGQANYSVVNGLGRLGMLENIWLDGSWYIQDARASRFAIIENNLLTMLSLETRPNKRTKESERSESFFTLNEMMAANLRSLLAAYSGMWTWPVLDWPDLPLSPITPGQAELLKPYFMAAELELNIL